MAARLCNWICVKPCEIICKGCNAMCKGCSDCCDAMCKACGDCCASCGRCCGQVCDPICRGCARCCEYPCSQLAQFCARPFSGTMILALLMNGAPFILGLGFGAMAFGGDGDCPRIGVWLVIQAFTALGHMIMAGYVFRLMQEPFDVENPSDRDMNSRVHHLVCYDVGFAIYILASIFQVVWLIVSPSTTPLMVMQDGEGKRGKHTHSLSLSLFFRTALMIISHYTAAIAILRVMGRRTKTNAPACSHHFSKSYTPTTH